MHCHNQLMAKALKPVLFLVFNREFNTEQASYEPCSPPALDKLASRRSGINAFRCRKRHVTPQQSQLLPYMQNYLALIE